MSELVDVERWRRWLVSRRGVRCWNDWAERRPSMLGWAPDALADPVGSEATDRLQHDLVALAQAGHGDAAVTLLVQLRRGLWRLVMARERALAESRREACDEVRAVFNETLYRHRLDRRPRKIAANLVLDTRQRLNRSQPRPLSPSVGTVLVSTGTAGPAPDALGPAWLLRGAIDRLPGTAASRAVTAEAAYRAWILDQPRGVIAGALGLEPAAVDTRLHRLRRVVRNEWERAA